ncbi:ankyrin repeat protein [Stachybotrys elegans]|uniref:Ankyrin repeat protein n=1 Tax=Stachybotrys elegans TaxID=80388 RepID=A0A8K0WN91_9HYPO|nr:ankyrin repeat protein [Stachybotrys elegans]
MDPITIIGLASSIYQLIEAANKVKSILQSFKDGDKELATLQGDIAAFIEALCGFDRILRSRHTIHRVSSSVLEDMLRSSLDNIIDLRNRLLQLTSSSLSAVRRAKWVQHKPVLKKLHSKIREKIAMLHTFLSITQAETFLTIAGQYPKFMISESAYQGGDVKTQPIEQTLLHVAPDDGHKRNSISSEQLSSSLSDTTSYMEQLSIFSSAPSVDSSTSTIDREDTEWDLATNDSHKGMHSVSQDAFLLRRSCLYNCYCKCHEATTDRPLSRFGRSKSQKAECTDSICLGNQVAQDSKGYSSLFRSALSRATSARVIQSRYDIQSFRMVPNGSNAVRYVNHGNLAKLRECIQSGEATIWDTTMDGWSLLHSAAYHGHSDIVKYLLDLGISTTTGDIGSRVPADLAVLKALGKGQHGSEQEVVEIFGKKDDVLADFEYNPIHLCVLNIYEYHLERPSLEELLELVDEANNAPVNTDWVQWKLGFRNRSPLFAAIIEYFRASAFELPKGTKIIHNLIDEKDKKFHWTPLHWAAYSGRVKEMRTLVKYGANCGILSNLGANIIHAAVESMVDSGLAAALKIRRMCPDELDINQVNSWGETAVHIASCISSSCVQLLLDNGANPNIRDENGQVALHFAASSDKVERHKIVAALCNAMDVEHMNARDRHGRPPLFDYLNDPICVMTLLRHGANVGLVDSEGRNAFHHACIHGEHDSLEVMMTDSQDPVTQDNHGNTPLIHALSNFKAECAMVLLRRDDVGPLIGEDGWQPIHYAAKIGDPELLQAVCNHGSFKRSAKSLDGKRAKIVAMEAGTWNGRIKELILEHDYIDWDTT